MAETDLSANASAALELREERRLVREGYDFLDEKRVLLATEILRRLAEYRVLHEDCDALQRQATDALIDAAGRHGLDGLWVYPVHELAGWNLEQRTYRVAGVLMLDESLTENTTSHVEVEIANPSPEARMCGELNAHLLRRWVALAGKARNLRRLAQEYRRTERRARALESVLIPELESALKFVEEQLDLYDLEEAVRVREAHRKRGGSDGSAVVDR